MRKKIISLLLALGMIVSFGGQAFAEPSESQLNDQLNQQQSNLQQNKNSLKNIQSKRSDLESSIEMLDNDIQNLMIDISNNKKKIEQTQKDITAAEADIKKAEDDMQAEKDLFNKRVRAMYISGLDGYLSILLESDGLNDFLSRIEAVKKIADADNKIIADLNAKKDEVSKKKEKLDKEKENLLALESSNEQKLAKLNDNKASQSKLIADLNAQENQYNSQIAESQKVIQQTQMQIQEIRSRVPKITPSRGSSTTAYSDDAVVAYASNFLGTTYVWGGTSPSPGFDCSGFVQYVYRHFGISLPRVADDQSRVGTTVSVNDLQPGDLVFFKKPGQPVHHVGMYVGNGCFIHAPQTGDVVKISQLSTRGDFYIAKRVK